MEINLENVNACLKSVMEQRSNLMIKLNDLEEESELLVDEEKKENAENEISKVHQEIKLLDLLVESYKLDLEIVELNQELLNNMISQSEYEKSVQK